MLEIRMRIASANLNKRLGSPDARARVESWLDAHKPDLFVSQEPFTLTNPRRPALKGFRMISSTPLVTCWAAEAAGYPKVLNHNDRWQEILIGNVVVHNIYLPDDSSKLRCQFLTQLADRLEHIARSGSVVLGDFNLAPRPDDGRFGMSASTFTKMSERRALSQLLDSVRMFDSTCPATGVEPEFTFERTQKNQVSRFRCDLAIISENLRGLATTRYDHSVRTGNGAFTDHSAIIVEIAGQTDCAIDYPPFSSDRPTSTQTAAKSIVVLDERIAPYKTAIRRRRESQIARELNTQGVLKLLGVGSILDFGCGYGADVAYYRGLGINADGYDSQETFGHARPMNRQYDLVTVIFVVNVLPTSEERLAAIREACEFVKPSGHLMIAARSESTIARAALAGKWKSFRDGFISHPEKRTFQKGISASEIGWLIGKTGLQLKDSALRLSRDVTWHIGVKPLAIQPHAKSGWQLFPRPSFPAENKPK